MKLRNEQEHKEWIITAKPASDNLLKSLGQKPCAASDCLNPVKSSRQDYCSGKCRNKQKSRRWRGANPEKYEESKFQYLKDMKEGRFQKRTGKGKL